MNFKVKKILEFVGLFVYAIGTFGGFGYSLSCEGGGFTAVCVLALGVMAFPTVKKCFNDLIGKD